MPYVVSWTIPARDKSASLWISLVVRDRSKARRYSAALSWIGHQLESAPLSGTKRKSDFILQRDFVEVAYTVSQVNQVVTIHEIELCGPGTPSSAPTP